MLDLVRLRVLAAVATHGTVTGAAKALNYSQPSVSHHLARLEAETGARLIQRVGRGIRLSAEGELLARRAKEILGRVDAAEAEVAALVGLQTGRLRIAAFQSALSCLVPPAAASLRERYPGLELRLAEAHPTVAGQQLRDGDVDVALLFTYSDAPPDNGIRYTHLLDDPMYLLTLQPGQTLDDHRESAWIGGCAHCRADLVRVCETEGFAPHIAYSSDDIVVDQALVAAGLGVTIMPGLALRTYQAHAIYANEIGLHRRIYLATYGAPPDPPATTAFATALQLVLKAHNTSKNTGPSAVPRMLPLGPSGRSHAVSRDADHGLGT